MLGVLGDHHLCWRGLGVQDLFLEPLSLLTGFFCGPLYLLTGILFWPLSRFKVSHADCWPWCYTPRWPLSMLIGVMHTYSFFECYSWLLLLVFFVDHRSQLSNLVQCWCTVVTFLSLVDSCRCWQYVTVPHYSVIKSDCSMIAKWFLDSVGYWVNIFSWS